MIYYLFYGEGMQQQKILMQVFDCDYVFVNGKPIVRIFGKTESGKATCVLWEKFLPYFYVQCPEEKFDSVIHELRRERSVEVVDHKTKRKTFQKKFYDVRGEVVEKFLPIGFGPQVKLLKVTGKDPGEVPEMRDIVQRMGYKIFEADILFKYRFMVDNNIKGMSWIEVEGNPLSTNTIKCDVINADAIKPIEILKNAPLKYMAIDIECANRENAIPDPSDDQIIAIALSFYPDYNGSHEIVLTAKRTAAQENVISCNNEEEMMKKFKDIINNYDPDVICGYNCENFDLPFILKRLEVLRIHRDIGRCDKSAFVKKLSHTQRTTITGRVVIDPFYIIRYLSIYDQPYRFKRFDLNTVSKAVLGIGKLEMGGMREIMALWKAGELQKLIEYSKRDAELALKLVITKKLVDMDKFIEIAKLSGLLLQDVMSGQAARHECSLLHILKQRNILMPCKPTSDEMKTRTSAGLKGALVLEPVVGLHIEGSVIVLDFTALYPSLIISRNICPTTMVKDEKDFELYTSPSGTSFVKHNVREGVLPYVAKYLLTTRAEIKKRMKAETDPEVLRILDAKQYALKGMAVSLYGYTAFAGGRFFVPQVAAAITSWGRENIEQTRAAIENNFPVKVIYGDTDSIFVETNVKDTDGAADLGATIAKFVTSKSQGLDLKFEKIFKSFLILTKKRYAGWSFEKEHGEWKSKIDMKGIETVRRDWCGLVEETMNEILKIILIEQDVKKACAHARQVIKDLQAGKVPVEKLTVTKGISKAIESYGGVNKSGGKISAPAHVQLAKKIISRDPSRGSLVGERIDYVIIKGNQMLSLRAEDPDYAKEKGLEVDGLYYVENQVLPPLERIFEACGIARSELVDGSRQKSLFELMNGKILSPEQTVLQNFDGVVCKNCSWTFRRPPLAGNCPSCSGQLYFSSSGSIGKFVVVN